MATTALFIEILIIGLEAATWIVLLALTLAGRALPTPADLKQYAASFKEWAALGTALGLAAAYVVGIVVDRVAETLHRWFEGTRPGQWINWYCGRGSYWYKFPARVAEMRLVVMRGSPGIASFLDYQRSRVRIVRATVLNVALALLFAGTYAARMPTAPTMFFWSFVILCAFLLAASVYASEQIHAAYLERLSDAYCLLEDPPLPESLDAVAAAVCYQWREGKIELLLVQTKGGRMWTFPKGHIEAGERGEPWKAAEREAREEAGVTGKSLKTPPIHYLYPKADQSEPKREDRVAAYLFEVLESDQEPDEAFRKPQWFPAEEAIKKLREGGRERRYRREHKRVVKASLKKIKALYVVP
jgi:8-oxo-dGTP pyrophosphatase MutT (NUDIX family)